MREARLSLRARLAESQELVDDADGEPVPAPRTLRPERTDAEPLREAVDQARERMLRKARAAGLD
jgi:hypothetical protein